MSTPEDIARALGGAKRSGSNWSCKCPAHEDNKASLSITQNFSGKLLVHCHAGCEPTNVISFLRAKGLWPDTAKTAPVAIPPPRAKIDLPPSQPTQSGRGRIVATYDYTDEDGELLYQAVRYDPKDFRQRAPNPDGSWSWSIKGVKRVLYRLPEVLAAVAEGKTIYICEGEKDVEAARSLGLVATCNAMGADNGTGNKWFPEFATALKGADVVVIPDQDEAGIRHAEWVISTLRGTAKSVKVVNPTSGKDLAEWVSLGATPTMIETSAIDAFEMDEAVPLKPERVGFKFLDVNELIKDIKPIQWLVRDYFERDAISLIYGPPACGKSFFAIDIVCSIAMGVEWMGHKTHSGPVFYIAGEGHNGLARRFKAWEVARGHKIEAGKIFKSAGALSILDEEEVQLMVEAIEAYIEQTGVVPAIVVVDTLARNFGAGDENSTEDMSRFIDHIDRYIRKRWQCNVLIVHHSGHNAERARGSSALKAAVDSEIEVTKDESGNVKIKATKMKDAELPQELLLKIKSVELPNVFDEDGNQVTSAILDVAGNLILSVVAKRDDGTEITAKDALEILDRGWLSVRDLGDALKCSKHQATKVLASLKGFKFTDGKAVTEEGKSALSRTGHMLTQQNKPVWKRTEE